MNIQQLLNRYELKTRQSIYNWCKALKIELSKDETGRVYVTQDQVEHLDQLKKHLSIPGNTLANFTPMSQVSIQEIDTSIDSQKIEIEVSELLAILLGDILSILKTRLPQSDVLWYHSTLERASAQSWLISTSQIQKIIGIKPLVKKGKKVYKRGNWLFVKQGKIGRETAWRVMKETKRETGIYEV
ncbi:hypothetical protein [Merismopedia glauca]|uniref:Uncharacterized protein n=1 Tax=Merismopedia glauca CCAP 1448/3 TaxID=1296344 RepID=A0A2T1BY20_9CYAN|nr:hypothetical protein [Merismopedia glauca]PSB00834.1 hypothetical protein C7B64_21415 [Merismopedia glauca CCAP 1448/3]